MKRKTYIFIDSGGRYRWHIKSSGKIIADSAEGYLHFFHCLKMAKSFGYPVYFEKNKVA